MTAAQARALDTLSDEYLLKLPEGPIGSSLWAAEFSRAAPLAIEIGFGNGVALAHLALANPDWNCVGVDVYRPGFGALMLACQKDGIGNVRIVESEALTLLRRLAPASVRLVNVFFPDPWPKARHHKRRLVNADFGSAVAGCLESAGTLSLATDWEPYAEQMVEILAAVPTLHGGQTERPDSRPMTAFEAKGTAAGRAVVDLTYRRVG
ncbi:MAG: tRNA (guanosine(46)-N7)-methyltransferase TrmB [Gammaproteobacteria bacterium]|nr:tRNA (guanosine(46)-N7)-methyltransferase TrmB [Gammaproteobacteria bacterium]